MKHGSSKNEPKSAAAAPLSGLSIGAPGRFFVYDSLLSEYAALGFEYGYSLSSRDALVVWEAQFGDFVNGAQIVIDQFISAAEDKWGQTSGLVLLLPHGYEGQGPEHSSGRIERFLTLAAEDNIQVVVPSTPAQYFHVLRRQMHRDIRKPLIVFTPKSLLRLPAASSRTEDLVSGHFMEVLPDPAEPNAERVRAVLLCSGRSSTTSPRRGGSGAQAVRWVQEEPENMGAYHFLHGRLHSMLPKQIAFDHAAREESGAPAAGSTTIHEAEQEDLLDAAFEGL